VPFIFRKTNPRFDENKPGHENRIDGDPFVIGELVGITDMAGGPAHWSGFAFGGVPVRCDADGSIRASVKGITNHESVNASSPCTNGKARASVFWCFLSSKFVML
jgi:hypothetical protein